MSKSQAQRWSLRVRARDNHTCDLCLSKSDLTAHHLDTRHNAKKFDTNNGITLCRDCHSRFHQSHNMTWSMKKPCTPQQYYNFKERYIKKAAIRSATECFNQGLTRCDNPYPSSREENIIWDRYFSFLCRSVSHKSYYHYIE